ncbi:DNA processing protein [Moraxella cuniculi DSM 21768]|uniref:DNA processing protein n=1 Tax=Moraxella cuniculi DSM 21768 TaxID=1122245 RepID=A0A1N7DVB6_9GAMM|nr:DNA-processing protein DprA [Moraxella cuniculi]OOS07409.1 DNA protecting protein DprA [Moraxella cuniculi]SIR79770.1 DNA processing protein [Moraxella cuniculi DSM 21768]
MAYSSLTDKQAVLALWYIVNTSLISYYKLITYCNNAKDALLADTSVWQNLAIHKLHIKRWHDSADVLAFVEKIKQEVSLGSYQVCFLSDDDYPPLLKEIYDPPPVLFYRGNIKRLTDRQIAIVGSRKPSTEAEKITFDLAQYLVQAGYTITSGLAWGIDKQAHLGAMAQLPALSGRTVGVLGTGIDVCYPRNHNALFAQIVQDGGCLVSELLPATPASKHTFPRRNRLVAGLSKAVVVTEAALQSGSLITARLCAEQGKQVFAIPSNIYNSNAEGCHHLIREGATLIYHPDQILEDVGRQDDDFLPMLPKTFSQGVSVYDGDDKLAKNHSSKSDVNHDTPDSVAVPEHLTKLYHVLDKPCDLDTLVVATNQEVGSLLAGLMELEILGLIIQSGGHYVKS